LGIQARAFLRFNEVPFPITPQFSLNKAKTYRRSAYPYGPVSPVSSPEEPTASNAAPPKDARAHVLPVPGGTADRDVIDDASDDIFTRPATIDVTLPYMQSPTTEQVCSMAVLQNVQVYHL